ncbi:MAG: zinc-dependent alcohol dehydrogenase family protein [Alphaproteobacteria bacterium]|nr:zinc-dependent alcohol dehydrogenase family protein [Alphaproteobacteria bacterium]
MKIVQFDRFGPAHDVSACVEVADPQGPASDEVIVDIAAFPINPADLLTIEGKYAIKPPLPATPGAEGVGTVRAVGSAVSDIVVGDRVIMLTRENWVQKRVAKASEVIKVAPDGDVLQQAMLKVNPATALLMLRNYIDLKPGDWVIQDAANSGVGNSVIRLAKSMGVKTVNVVRREELIAPLTAMGADVVVLDGDGLTERVAAATDNGNIRLGIDAVAGDTSLRVAECLGENAKLVNYGMLSGEPCKIMPDQVVFKGIDLTGFWLAKDLGSMSRSDAEKLYGELSSQVSDGSLSVSVEASYDIADIKDALAHAAREGRNGKILVRPN